MSRPEQYPASSRSVANLREVRLLGLLRDVVAEYGKVKAAATLGVSFRTLSRAEATGRLTPRLADALESHLGQGGGTAAARQRRQVGELADRLAALEQALVDGLAELRQEGERASEGQVGAIAELERRLTALESAGNVTAAPGAGSSAPAGGKAGGPAAVGIPSSASVSSNPAQSAKPVVERPRRDYYDLVTAEAEPGEELVYGDPATAVIVQWREARDAVGQCEDSLDRLNARERWLRLEIELIEEHKLTLPPVTYPWDWGDRRQEARRRTEYLDDLRVERNRLKLRRFLTFGLWRN